ncbi:hypothetical protein D3C84_1228950 [compost metagenome]
MRAGEVTNENVTQTKDFNRVSHAGPIRGLPSHTQRFLPGIVNAIKFIAKLGYECLKSTYTLMSLI